MREEVEGGKGRVKTLKTEQGINDAFPGNFGGLISFCAATYLLRTLRDSSMTKALPRALGMCA